MWNLEPPQLTPSLSLTPTEVEALQQQKLLIFLWDKFLVLPVGSEYEIFIFVKPITISFYRAPTDCVQYFTGKTGSVKSYNFGGGQLLQSQIYTNCIRTEAGYCAIQWKESSTTSPDPFGVGASPTTQIESNGCDASAAGAFIFIPNMSQDGIQKLPIPVSSTYAYQTQLCGSNFGIEGMGTIAQPLISKCTH